MKRQAITIFVALVILGGVAAFNMYYHREPEPAELQEQQAEAAERVAELEEAAAEAEEAEEEAAAPEIEIEAETQTVDAGADAAGDAQEESETVAESVDTSEWPEEAPETFKVKFETTEGDFVIEAHKDWAPRGTQRFYELVRSNYFEDMRIFRVVSGFVVQFGISGDPALNREWRSKRIQDDPVKQSNLKGYVSFAAAGPNSRTTQIFINTGNNPNLDTFQQGFPPFGKVVEGMETVESFYAGYGDKLSNLQGPFQEQGNVYMDERYPELDSIERAYLIKE